MLTRSVVVVEDEALLRDLIAQSLETAGFLVTTAANAADAKRVCLATDPDAVVVDIELGAGPDGFEFAEALHKETPDVGIVFLTNLPDSRFAGRDVKNLPRNVAYLRKSQLTETRELVNALEAVLSDSRDGIPRHDLQSDRPMAELSRRQISVLQLLAHGFSNSQIAEQRGTSVRAVEGIISRIFSALAIDPGAEGNARVEAAREYLTVSGHSSPQLP
jgi:DNA-binding NarL/FixJ family response regulator